MASPAGAGFPRLLAGLDERRRREVLTHRSWAHRGRPSYERLEFLGDSVLEVIVRGELMRRHPGADEGELSWMRQAVVNREVCAEVASAAGLAELAVASAPPSRSESARGVVERVSVRAALTEALIGAAWLDLGPAPTAEAVREAFAPALAGAVPGVRDPKTTLQEEAARRRVSVAYELVGHEGPPEERTFTSRVLVAGRVLGQGEGASKQASEQAAARRALEDWRGSEPGEATAC